MGRDMETKLVELCVELLMMAMAILPWPRGFQWERGAVVGVGEEEASGVRLEAGDGSRELGSGHACGAGC